LLAFDETTELQRLESSAVSLTLLCDVYATLQLPCLTNHNNAVRVNAKLRQMKLNSCLAEI